MADIFKQVEELQAEIEKLKAAQEEQKKASEPTDEEIGRQIYQRIKHRLKK